MGFYLLGALSKAPTSGELPWNIHQSVKIGDANGAFMTLRPVVLSLALQSVGKGNVC